VVSRAIAGDGRAMALTYERAAAVKPELPALPGTKGATPGRPGVSRRERLKALGYPTGSLLGMLALWQLVVIAFKPPEYLVPSPRAVWEEFVLHYDLLLMHTWVTTQEMLAGFGLSVAISIPMALAIATWKPLERTIYPLLVVSQAVPKVAVAPLLLVWMGFGLTPKIFVAVLIAFFPIVISTVTGLKSVPYEMLQLSRSMGLSVPATLVKIKMPYSLPHIFAGLKVGITLAVVGAVVGEFVGADRGLGYLLLFTLGRLNTRLMFADLACLVALGVVSFWLVQFLERKAIPWHVSVRLDNPPPMA
jgi:NitT/TauT family transport system permease protein